MTNGVQLALCANVFAMLDSSGKHHHTLSLTIQRLSINAESYLAHACGPGPQAHAGRGRRANCASKSRDARGCRRACISATREYGHCAPVRLWLYRQFPDPHPNPFPGQGEGISQILTGQLHGLDSQAENSLSTVSIKEEGIIRNHFSPAALTGSAAKAFFPWPVKPLCAS